MRVLPTTEPAVIRTDRVASTCNRFTDETFGAGNVVPHYNLESGRLHSSEDVHFGPTGIGGRRVWSAYAGQQNATEAMRDDGVPLAATNAKPHRSVYPFGPPR